MKIFSSKQRTKAHTTNSRRRQLLALTPILGITACTRLPTQLTTSGIQLDKLHCFEIRVSNVQRSIQFYQDLFGMAVQSSFAGRTCLRIGDTNQTMAIRQIHDDETPAITSLGYSVQHYDISSQLAELERIGFTQTSPPATSAIGLDHAMTCWLLDRSGTPELYFADARGVIVQLTDPSYCGGGGPLGSLCEINQPSQKGLFSLTEINHFTAFVNDGAGANLFYQQHFDLQVQAFQGPNSPVTGIGDGYQFVMYAGPFPGGENAPANLHHGCFNMLGFNEDDILAKLTNYGLEAKNEQTIGPLMHYVSRRMPARGGAQGGTPEIYFTDPDGILMQLQHEDYCGGGGYLGDQCLNV